MRNYKLFFVAPSLYVLNFYAQVAWEKQLDNKIAPRFTLVSIILMLLFCVVILI